MAACAKSNCKKPANDKGKPPTLCADHQRLKAQEDLKQAQQKKQLEESLKKTEEARKEMALKAKEKEEAAAEKKKQIGEIAVLWNAQVRKVVSQVKKLRSENPENSTRLKRCCASALRMTSFIGLMSYTACAGSTVWTA